MIVDFKAHKAWNSVPREAQNRLLSNVWCGQCRGGTTITNFEPALEGSMLVLKGICITCNQSVARVID